MHVGDAAAALQATESILIMLSASDALASVSNGSSAAKRRNATKPIKESANDQYFSEKGLNMPGAIATAMQERQTSIGEDRQKYCQK